jgi:hypothetical protein
MSHVLVMVIKCLGVGIKYLNVNPYFFLSLRDNTNEWFTY